jgi:molybdenum cofactor cytidylyltransferase
VSRPALAGVILAAGGSTRMGRSKALLPYPLPLAGDRARPAPPEPTFLAACAYKLAAACAEVFVVIPAGAGGEALRAAGAGFASPIAWIENPAAERGQFHSLQLAAAAVLKEERFAGAVICPVDRPMFAAATVAALVGAFNAPRPLAALTATAGPTVAAAPSPAAAIVKPSYAARHGHPVLYSREFLAAVAAASADGNARDLARGWAERTVTVAVGDPGILVNVDTPADYRRLDTPGAR